MTARAELPTWLLHAALAATGLLVGVLAGYDPKLAIVFTLAIGFVVVTVVNLTAGLCLFAILSFVDTILPSGGVISVPKLMGLLLMLSWFALLTAGGAERRQQVFSHPAFLFVLALFVGWVCMSATWAEEVSGTLDTLERVLPNVFLFLIVFSAVRTRDDALWLVGALVIGAFISASYGLMVPVDPGSADRLSGGTGNANETAAALVVGGVLAAGLAAALREQPLLRLAAICVAPLCAYGVFLTLSRGGLVALAAALVTGIVMAGRWRWIAILLVGVAISTAVVYFVTVAPPEARDRVTKFEGGTGRTDIWKVGWRMVEAEPVHGIGAGNFANTSVHYLLQPGALMRSDFIVDTPKVAHNMYLEVLAELGIVGAALFGAILIFSLVCTFKAIRGFERAGDRGMEILSRALFIALVALLASDVFGSRQYSKQLWLLLSLGPAFLAIARAQLERGSSQPELVRG
jgi:O-antigen ligase